jgi:hypothetical protein
MNTSRIRGAIWVVPICAVIAGCLTDGTLTPNAVAIPPGTGGGDSPLGDVYVDGALSEEAGVKCVVGFPVIKAHGGDVNNTYETSAGAGISAIISGWFGASADANRVKKVTISAKDIQHEVLTAPYPNQQSQGRCNGFQVKNAYYVQSADKAKTVKYTLMDEGGAAAEVDACKAKGPIAAGGSAHVKATYSNQIELNADLPVYFEATLKSPLPTSTAVSVVLNSQPVGIPNTYPASIFAVSGPLPPANNPSYTLKVGPNPTATYTFFESQMGWPQRLDIGGVPFDVTLYRDPNQKLAIQFTQAGLPASVAAAAPTGSASSAPGPGPAPGANNPPPAAPGPAPQTSSPCPATASGPGGSTPTSNQPKPPA